ncbi:hypothetical protein vseg_002843 [Gypsophila vaccaria]
MGGREGHVLLGLVFVMVGLWHLYNQIKIHSTHRNTFRSLLWFPTKFSRYLELYLILLGCSIFSLVELRLAPFDADGTFKASHLHHIEHACIAIAFCLHALFAILLDKFGPNPKSKSDLGHFLAAMAFAEELLLFHFHTTDHVGLEGQYHWLLQQLVSVCLVFTLLSIWLPKSFMVCFIRSLGIIFQGLWLIVMGYMLWTPSFAPKGCALHKDHYGKDVIKCDDHESLHRAKALVNILFSWFFIGMMCFCVSFYWCINMVYEVNVELIDDDVSLEEVCHSEDMQGFLHAKKIVPFDLEV